MRSRAWPRSRTAGSHWVGEFKKDKETEANVETQLADVKAKMAAMQTDMSAKLDAILEKLDTQ